MTKTVPRYSKTRRIDCIVGARPNFMKIAPILRAFGDTKRCTIRLIHTGQHYDESMSAVFFDELGIPAPDINLEVGSGTGTEQTARVMLGLEPLLVADRPDMLLVVGDVNSTLAAALVAAKLLVPLAHVEAGLRSKDRTMPEETNRLITDQLADLLLTTERESLSRLVREGIAAGEGALRRQCYDRHSASQSVQGAVGQRHHRAACKRHGIRFPRISRRLWSRHAAPAVQRRQLDQAGRFR